jgi:hypothetical protein
VVRIEQFAGGVRIPRQKADAAPFAIGERFLMAPVGQTVSILNSRDGDVLLALFDLGGVTSLRPMWRIFPWSWSSFRHLKRDHLL